MKLGNMGWGASVALVAGLLTFTGSQTLAGDKDSSKSSATGSSTTGNTTDSYGSMGTRSSDTSSPGMGSGSADSKPTGSGTSEMSSGTSSGASATAPSGLADAKQVTGRIDNFDRSTNTLTVSGKTLKVDSSTEVMKDGTRAAISDIQEGDQVRASFSGSGDLLSAQRLEVMTKGSTGGISSSTGADKSSGTGSAPGTTSSSQDSSGASGASSDQSKAKGSGTYGAPSGTSTGSPSGTSR